MLRIHFDGLDDDVIDADVRVVLEDVSEADAPAPVVGRWLFSGQSIAAGPAMIEVGIDPGTIDRPADTSVRVHVDVDRSGTLTAGDFVSTAVQPLAGSLPDPPPSASPTVADDIASIDPLQRRTIVVHVERV